MVDTNPLHRKRQHAPAFNGRCCPPTPLDGRTAFSHSTLSSQCVLYLIRIRYDRVCNDTLLWISDTSAVAIKTWVILDKVGWLTVSLIIICCGLAIFPRINLHIYCITFPMIYSLKGQ